jgi:hypothetical protein
MCLQICSYWGGGGGGWHWGVATSQTKPMECPLQVKFLFSRLINNASSQSPNPFFAAVNFKKVVNTFILLQKSEPERKNRIHQKIGTFNGPTQSLIQKS